MEIYKQKGRAQVILSVIIPSYNVEAYLSQTLESLCLPSMRTRLEALVINDGSIDATRDIALEWMRREPDIVRLIDKENGGHGSAVNAGINAACGKYVRIVDGDDWLESASLPALINALEQSEADIVVDQKFENNHETGEETLFPLPDTLPFGQIQRFMAHSGENMTEYYMLHTLCVRRALLQALDVRLLEHTFYVDFEYILKVTSRAQSIEFLPLNVYHYRVGNAAQSVAPLNYVKRQSQHRRVLDECLRFRRALSDADAETRAYVTRRCALLINTHLTIHLIYDRDRRRGAQNARAFMAELKQAEPELHDMTMPRYRLKRGLHALGFTENTIAWLRRARRRKDT